MSKKVTVESVNIKNIGATTSVALTLRINEFDKDGKLIPSKSLKNMYQSVEVDVPTDSPEMQQLTEYVKQLGAKHIKQFSET